MERKVYRGDTYNLRRSVFVVTLTAEVNDALVPLPMAGYKVRTTFKVEPTDPNTDTTDVTAALKGDITFDAGGVEVGTPSGLRLPDGMTASQGVLWITATTAQTLALPLGTVLKGDIQVTDDNNEHFTIVTTATLVAVDGYTNRTA